jgi:hypothetical protein
MTTKTTNLAMFAIAAFALGGMMVTPAFATNLSHDFAITSAPGGYSKVASNICGGGQSIYSSANVYTSPQQYVKVVANAADCGSHSNTSVSVTVNGNFFGSSSTSDGNKTFYFNGSISAGDDVRVYIDYTY